MSRTGASTTQPWSRLVAMATIAFCVAASAGAADFPTRLPLSAKQWNERGSQLAQEQQWQPAIDAFTEAIKLEPKRSELLVNRAVARQKLGDWSGAEADCTAAATLNPEDTRAFLQRAIARSEQGRNEEAFADASRAVRMEPENAQCVFIRHYVASCIGRHDLGHVAGENYIGIRGWTDPWSSYVALLNYVSLRRAGNDPLAKAALAEAAASLPINDWPMPVIQFLRGDLDEAALFAQALEPDRATLARYYVGMHHWLAGDEAKAKELFSAIVATGDRSYLQTKLAEDHLKELPAPAPAVPPASKE